MAWKPMEAPLLCALPWYKGLLCARQYKTGSDACQVTRNPSYRHQGAHRDTQP